MESFTLHRGRAPLLISLPHDASAIPDAIAVYMTPAAQRAPDTDWHVGQLYDFARDLGASVLRPHWSRYVVDLNRPPDGHVLYPGQSETQLVPTTMFDGEPIYLDGQAPDAADVAARADEYWQPYHAALVAELQRLRARHGRVVLWDAHSIRSQVPMFFDGQLPDFNVGTAAGTSCSASLQRRVMRVLQGQSRYSHVLNGRFKGGFITRHYGQPHSGVDAVQLELAQLNYMDEASFDYLPEHARPVQAVIRSLLLECVAETA